MKRFLFSALGTFGLASLALADTPTKIAMMPKADTPVMKQSQPAPLSTTPVVIDDACKPSRNWSIIGGADALFLRPHFSSNPALTLSSARVFQTESLDSLQLSNTTQEFEYDWSLSPRIWIGIQNDCGLGLRGRWFRFDHSADSRSATDSAPADTDASTFVSSAPVGNGNFFESGLASINPFGQPGTSITTQGGAFNTVNGNFSSPLNDQLEATTSLYIDQWDVEITQAIRRGAWNITVAAGARYAHIEQTYNAFHPGKGRSDINNGVVTDLDATEDTLISRQTFTGAGPLLGLEVERQIAESNFHLYGMSRASVLFGRGRQRAGILSNSIDFDPEGDSDQDVFTSFFANDGLDIIPTLEIEAGVTYSREVGAFQLMVRPAVVGMVYFDGGSGSSRNGDFGLFGATLTAGFGF